jgi:hypothetical protein
VQVRAGAPQPVAPTAPGCLSALDPLADRHRQMLAQVRVERDAVAPWSTCTTLP